MGLQDYRLILEAACIASPDRSADSIFRGNLFISNGARVWFQYFEPADLCRIVIDLGPIEEKARANVRRMMLEFNCTNSSDFLPYMALNPETGNAILVMHLSMEKFEFHARKPNFFSYLDEVLAPLLESWCKGNDAISGIGELVKPILNGFA
jgi:hypothetical protein